MLSNKERRRRKREGEEQEQEQEEEEEEEEQNEECGGCVQHKGNKKQTKDDQPVRGHTSSSSSRSSRPDTRRTPAIAELSAGPPCVVL